MVLFAWDLSFSLVFIFHFALFFPEEFVYYMSCRLGWNGLICLICAHLEEPSTLHPPQSALSADYISYLSTVLDLD